jgi:hypothetical protein
MTSKHTGGCHCGAVRYEVEADIGEVMSCNCSMCQMRGSLLSFVPEQQFSLLSGGDNLTDYQFNKKIIHHLFCSTCGVASFARGVAPDESEMVAINVRCVDDIDLDALAVKQIDGRSF